VRDTDTDEVEHDLWLRHRWRFLEARREGMGFLEAKMFADSEIDISELRRLVEHGCPPVLLASILL
jgi:hypothetical protein